MVQTRHSIKQDLIYGKVLKVREGVYTFVTFNINKDSQSTSIIFHFYRRGLFSVRSLNYSKNLNHNTIIKSVVVTHGLEAEYDVYSFLHVDSLDESNKIELMLIGFSDKGRNFVVT